MFGFQRLDAYRAATEFLGVTWRIVGQNPEGTWRNCRPASARSLSVPLNIAEGSGKFNRDAVRFYTIARGSALECAAILDALEVTTVFNEADLKQGRDLLERIVSMLTGLIKP